MENMDNKYISVSYRLYVDNEDGRVIVEEMKEDQPFAFITGFGITLEDFEKELEHPRRMLGPMPKDWAGIRKAGLDWFLIRWMTARNIVSDFCLLFIVVKVILLMIA